MNTKCPYTACPKTERGLNGIKCRCDEQASSGNSELLCADFKEWWEEYGSIDYDEMCQAKAAWDYQEKRIRAAMDIEKSEWVRSDLRGPVEHGIDNVARKLGFKDISA